MSFIFEAGKHPHRYIYLGYTYRDKDKKTVNKRVRIGKIDPTLKIPVYDINFFKQKELRGIDIPSELQANALTNMINDAKKILNLTDNEKREISPYTIALLKEVLELNNDKLSKNTQQANLIDHNKPLFSLNDIKLSVKKKYGLFYLFDGISEQIRLKEALKMAFPYDWKKIFMLACYLISTDDEVMYCQNWLNKVEGLPVTLTPKDINELLTGISLDKINNFYAIWANLRSETELLALDITPISSYSSQISKVEYVYNRENDTLGKINAYLLLGQTSKLPIYFKPYSGSITDLSALKETIGNLDNTKISLIMDKGFASINNINEMLTVNEMLTEPQKINFLISLPFTLNYAKKTVLALSDSIVKHANVLTSARHIWATTLEDVWPNGCPVYLHAYFNARKNHKDTYGIHSEVEGLLAKLTTEGIANCSDKELKKWGTVSHDKNQAKIFHLNEAKIIHSTTTAGWFLLLSNFISDKTDLLHLYKTKDILKIGFFKFNAQLGLKRLIGHSDQVTHTKLLLTFISLILLSHINKTMSENDLYTNFTINSLIQEMESLEVTHVKESIFLSPISSIQKRILNSFNLKEPNI